MPAELFANNFSTTLTVGCAPGDGTIHVQSAAPAALQGGQFRILVDTEYMIVTAGQSGTTWTVTRAAEGTSAGTHFAGVYVTHLITAAGIANLSGAVTSVAGKTGTVTLASTDLTDSAGLERGANKDAVNGYAGLDSSGLLKAAELPSSVERITSKDAVNGYAGLDSGGKLKVAEIPTRPWLSKAGDYQMAATDGGVLATVTCTITLPSSPVAGLLYGVKADSAAAQPIVSTGTSAVIDAGSVNSSTVQIVEAGACVTFTVAPNGTDWQIVAVSSYGPLTFAPIPIPPVPVIS